MKLVYCWANIYLLLRPRPHVSGDFCIGKFFMRIHLASTRVRRRRSVYPEISVYALHSGNFCIRCVSGYVWTPVSVYFCIRWRHSIRTSLNAHALLTNPLRCPDTNRIRVDGRILFVYATCGRRYFCIRIKKFADTRISGYVWTGPYISHFLLIISCRHLKHTADKSTCAWEFKKSFIFCFITLRCIQAKINEQLNGNLFPNLT